MRRILCMLLCLTLMLPLLPIMAETAEDAPALAIAPITQTIRPGKAILLSFTVPTDGVADIVLLGEAGDTVLPIVVAHPVTAGENHLWWNGTYGGVFAPTGTLTLALIMDGATFTQTVTIGSAAPYITSITVMKDVNARIMRTDFYASVDGLLTVGLWADDAWSLIENRQISAGMNGVTWDASTMPMTATALTLTLTDATGFSSNEEHIAVSPEDFGMATATPVPTEEPTVEPTEEPTATPTAEPTATPTAEPTATPTLEPTATPTAEPTATPTPTPEPTATPSPTPVPTPDITFTPSYGSPYEVIEGEAPNFWNTPMDITDEAAVWAMLTAPITVVDNGSRDAYKGQTKVYAEPSEDSRAVAVVTGESQGVRVIEHLDNGWSLIELYSSTFHDNSIQAWNMLVQGYVRTEYLVTKEVTDKYHIVVDKLTQRLYLFGDGHLISTLLISTGLANAEQPYNETRSGEFLYISPTGGFQSDNMFCPLAMKFNDGDLLHEVPYIQRYEGGTKIYTATEPYLGSRASHGCIRVQRKKTPEGINMQWIWNNRKEIGRIVIWEDWQGRQIPYPSDNLLLYYNPKGGSYYHRGETCSSAKASVRFESFTYAELDTGKYADLEYCPYCAPVMRRADIDAVNAAHAFGGDHDPVLTEARMKYLRTIPDEALTPGEQRYWVDFPAELAEEE